MNQTDHATLQHAQHLQALIRHYRHSQVLITCTDLGVFRTLAGGAKRADTLAEELDVDASALRRLLNAAVALELLEREAELYRNAPATAAVLAEDRHGYLGHLFARENAFYDRWGRLTDAVRTGERPEPNRKMEDTSDWVRDFEYALYDLARLYGTSVAGALDLDPRKPWRVLDVGGGHGGYSIALARRYPHLTVTVLDLPAVIEVAREIVGATEVADRIELRAGDFMEADLGNGYDLVLLFGVLISEPRERRLKLLCRLHMALASGGRLALREFIMEDDGTGELDVLLFDLQMLLSAEAGGALRHGEIVAELEAVGFGPVEERRVPGMSPIWLAPR